MAESTLSKTYDDLRLAVARYLDFATSSADLDNMDDRQDAVIEDCVVGGISQFYYPPAGSGESHRWTFLRPVAQLSLTADDGEYDLPDNFESIVGSFTFSDTSSPSWEIPVIPETTVRRLRAQSDDSTGYPQYAAIRPKSHDGTTGQRFEVVFYPVPNESMTLEYRYVVQANALTDSAGYPFGGGSHSQTIEESCLAFAEHRYDDSATTHHQERFFQLLQASISRDRRQCGPSIIGYNGDNGSWRDGSTSYTGKNLGGVTVFDTEVY